MKHVLFYIAAAVVVIAAAVFVWSRFLSTKGTDVPYVDGKGRGTGVDFMDPSKVQSGITPVKGGFQTVARPAYNNPWAGKFVAIKSSVPTGNPVRTQLKTIW